MFSLLKSAAKGARMLPDGCSVVVSSGWSLQPQACKLCLPVSVCSMGTVTPHRGFAGSRRLLLSRCHPLLLPSVSLTLHGFLLLVDSWKSPLMLENSRGRWVLTDGSQRSCLEHLSGESWAHQVVPVYTGGNTFSCTVFRCYKVDISRCVLC